jgi:hypothetical protein
MFMFMFLFVLFQTASTKVGPLEAAAARAQKELADRQRDVGKLASRAADAQATLASCLADVEDAKAQQVLYSCNPHTKRKERRCATTGSCVKRAQNIRVVRRAPKTAAGNRLRVCVLRACVLC